MLNVGKKMNLIIFLICQSSVYHIYSAIRQGFSPLLNDYKLLNQSCKFAIIQMSPFLNKPKDLDPSYKMDLDFLDDFGREQTLSYNRRNMISGCL